MCLYCAFWLLFALKTEIYDYSLSKTNFFIVNDDNKSLELSRQMAWRQKWLTQMPSFEQRPSMITPCVFLFFTNTLFMLKHMTVLNSLYLP